MIVLGKALGVEILAGEPRPNERACYIKLRHSRLPRGGVLFALPFVNARAIAARIVAVCDGELEPGTGGPE